MIAGWAKLMAETRRMGREGVEAASEDHAAAARCGEHLRAAAAADREVARWGRAARGALDHGVAAASDLGLAPRGIEPRRLLAPLDEAFTMLADPPMADVADEGRERVCDSHRRTAAEAREAALRAALSR